MDNKEIATQIVIEYLRNRKTMDLTESDYIDGISRLLNNILVTLDEFTPPYNPDDHSFIEDN